MMHARTAAFGAALIFAAAALGGCQGGGATAPRFDTGTAYPWVTKSSLPVPLTGLGAASINGSVYAMGSMGDPFRSTALAYNPSTNTWSVKADMPSSRTGFGVGGADNFMYVIGGARDFIDDFGTNLVEAYDPSSNTWTTKAPMLNVHIGSAIGGTGHVLYAASSINVALFGFTAPDYNALYVYDSAANSWAPKPVWPSKRLYPEVGVVSNVLYVIGGSAYGIGTVGNVEAYDPSTNAWTTRAPMPTPRTAFAIGVVNGILYAIGGRDGNAHETSAVEAYDPSTNTWTTKPPMPTARAGLSVAQVNNTLYAMGGIANGHVLKTVEAYTP